jgi:hypothetical protein
VGTQACPPAPRRHGGRRDLPPGDVGAEGHGQLHRAVAVKHRSAAPAAPTASGYVPTGMRSVPAQPASSRRRSSSDSKGVLDHPGAGVLMPPCGIPLSLALALQPPAEVPDRSEPTPRGTARSRLADLDQPGCAGAPARRGQRPDGTEPASRPDSAPPSEAATVLSPSRRPRSASSQETVSTAESG